MFPREEKYSLIDQLCCPSRSIGAQNAEDRTKRHYERHFASKLTDADSEVQETEYLIDTLEGLGYLNTKQATDLNNNLSEISQMLYGMINQFDLFSNSEHWKLITN